jgi:tetratricopeptide (TPR) repeat protein
MAKPMLVTLPLVLLLLDYWPLGRMTAGAGGDMSVADGERSSRFVLFKRLLLEKLPLLLLAVTSCLMTLWAQGAASALNEQIPLGSRIANALVSYVAYLGQLFCPVGLAAHYPHPEGDLPVWKVMGALVVLACISAGVLAWRRRYPYVLVGWLWYVGMLVPVIGLVQVGKIAMADRYTYLPQIGLGIALAWGAIDVCRSRRYRRWLCGVTSGLVLAALMGCAWRQTSFWRDSETLWNHALACTSQAFVVHTNLGHALANQGRMDEAMAHYQKALEIQPNYVEAHNNLGYAFACLDRFDEAMAQYQEAVEIQPDCVEARYNLGNALARLDRFDEAITQYRKALDVRPDYAEAHNNLGYALANRGRMDEAMAQYQKALEIQPDYADAHYNLGDVSAARSLFDEAIRHYRKALDLATRHNNQPLADAARAKIEEYEAGKALPQPRPTPVRPPSP